MSTPTINFDAVKDSGERQEFDTGSRRDTRKRKGRYDLMSPIAMRRLAVHFENGAAKYGERNWEKGQPVSRYVDSALRHLFDYLGGDTSEDHLAAAVWNAGCAMHTEEECLREALPPHLLDLPHHMASCVRDHGCEDS